MAYKNGNYIAFVGCGTTDVSKNDRGLFEIVKIWGEEKGFKFVNSHDKTYQVKDTSSKETLYSRLRERLNNSKNMVLLVSEKTRKYCSEILEYELNYAISNHLPIIVVIEDYDIIKKVDCRHKRLLPELLEDNLNKIPTLFIPFKKKALKEALSEKFDIHNLGLENYIYSYTNKESWD
jgi:hypothetical protein